MSGRVAWSCFNPWHGHACYCRPAPTPSASLLHGILFDDPGRPNNNRTAGPITNSARAVTLWRDEIAGPILPGCRDDRRIPPRPGVTDGARRSFSHCIAPASAFLRTKSRGLPSSDDARRPRSAFGCRARPAFSPAAVTGRRNDPRPHQAHGTKRRSRRVQSVGPHAIFHPG